MYGVVLATLDLYRHRGESGVIVDEIIDLTLVPIVVVKQLVAMSNQFTGNGGLVDGTQVDAGFVV